MCNRLAIKGMLHSLSEVVGAGDRKEEENLMELCRTFEVRLKSEFLAFAKPAAELSPERSHCMTRNPVVRNFTL